MAMLARRRDDGGPTGAHAVVGVGPDRDVEPGLVQDVTADADIKPTGHALGVQAGGTEAAEIQFLRCGVFEVEGLMVVQLGEGDDGFAGQGEAAARQAGAEGQVF